MSKCLETIVLAGSILIAAYGAYDLLRPRTENYGLNAMAAAGLMARSDEGSTYARKTLPGALLFFGSAGAMTYVLSRKKM